MTPGAIPDLRFGPGPDAGFTPAGVAAFDDLRPPAVVRELIQNALDAARSAGVNPAVVRFRLFRAPRNKVPGIQSYRTAFDKALQTQEKMANAPVTGPAGIVVQRIRDALAQDEMDVLEVLDNGIGLDARRMTALLSDGVSVKGTTASTGTYGNGHSTAIPASDLRYILYGGITQGGDRLGAGHAVIASHYEEGERHRRSGDGLYIRDFRASPDRPYDYATGEDIPDLISRAIDRIERDVPEGRAPCGTAVIIPYFNHFLKARDLRDVVLQAASANFFIAIEEGSLVVSVEDNRRDSSGPSTLDDSNLGTVLADHRDMQRTKAFLNGRRAYEAHDVYRSGHKRVIQTAAGAIKVRLREKADGITRVDLCRNGMWITDKIPSVTGNLADQMPFHAVLSLDAERGGDLHRYIRDAEGPLHDSIAVHRLPKPELRACRAALRQIRDWLVKHTRAVEAGAAYLVDDFLALDFGNPGGAFLGVPTAIRRSPARERFRIPGGLDDLEGGNGGSGGGGGSGSGRHRARPWLPATFSVTVRPVCKRRRHIWIECVKSCRDAQMRLVADEALDATCERPGQDPYAPATLSKVTLRSEPATDADLVRWENRVIGVRLGDLAEGDSVEVETDYDLDGDFSGLKDTGLQVQVFSAKSIKEAAPGANGSEEGEERACE